MRRYANLPNNMKQIIKRELEDLNNAEIITIDQVNDKEIYSAFYLFGVEQSSFEVKSIYGQRGDNLRAINGDIAVPVEENYNGLEDDIKDFAVDNPDRVGVQSRLKRDGNMCVISYNNREYTTFMDALQRFDEEYEEEFL